MKGEGESVCWNEKRGNNPLGWQLSGLLVKRGENNDNDSKGKRFGKILGE